MDAHHHVGDPCEECISRASQEGKRGYNAPRLVCYGDVRNLTLGGSPGIGESGPFFEQLKP